MSYSRRDFGKAALAGLTMTAIPGSSVWAQARNPIFANSNVRGVQLGMIGNTLQGNVVAAPPPGSPPVPPAPPAAPADPLVVLDQFIADLKTLGIQYVESTCNATGQPRLVGGTLQQNRLKAGTPVSPEYIAAREAIRQWRLTAPLDFPRAAAAKFKAAGIDFFSGVVTIEDDCTDAEIDAIFKRLQASGVRQFCTNGTRVNMASKLIAPAAKYKIKPAFHTHDQSDDPDEVASRASLEKLLAMSPDFMINLDIGHYTAGNEDALAFVMAHPTRISHLHVKDRKKNHGPSVIWGTGDTPIKPILRAIRDHKFPIKCIIERDNRDESGTQMALIKKYMDYMKETLET